MKVTRYDLDDDEDLAAAHVVLTRDELALLYRLTGHTAPSDVTAVAGPGLSDALMDIAGTTGSIFNTFYEDGVNEVAHRFTLNDIAAAAARRQAAE